MIITYAIMIIIGFVPFIITLFKMKRINKMRMAGIKTTAVVKELYGMQLRGINKVLIEFNLETGQLVSQVITVGGVPYKLGDKLPLIYERNNPAKNIVDPGKYYKIISVIAFLLGIGMIGACYLIQGSIESGEL